jgi:ATP-dependent Clp protease, protease subunit
MEEDLYEEEQEIISHENMQKKTRNVFLNEDISQSSVERVVDEIRNLCYMDYKAPVNLYINCQGGSMFNALYLVSFILNTSTKIITIATAECQSAGFLVFLAGHYRICYETTLFMWHEAQIAYPDAPLKSLKSYGKVMDKYENLCRRMFVERSVNVNDQWINRQVERDAEWYIPGFEALMMGFVEEVIPLNFEMERTNGTHISS